MATINLNKVAATLTKAIAYAENGGKPNLQNPSAGSSGELASIFQYTPGTWKSVAAKYLGDANATLNTENETKASYLRISDWLKNGKSPAQIASMWNAGEGEPNAYTGKFSSGKSSVGRNDYGVLFNVPAYSAKVQRYANQLWVPDTEATPITEEPKKNNLFQSIVTSALSFPVNVFRIFKAWVAPGDVSDINSAKNKALLALDQPVELPLNLGTIAPLKQGVEGAKQMIGQTLEFETFLLPYGKVAKISEGVLANFLSKNAANILSKGVAGMTGGYLSETGVDLEENKSLMESFTPGYGTLAGFVIPTAISGTGKGISFLWNKTSDFITDILPAKISSKFINADGSVVPIDAILNSKIAINNKSLIKSTNVSIREANDALNALYSEMGIPSKINLKNIILEAQNKNSFLFRDAGLTENKALMNLLTNTVPEVKTLFEKSILSMSEANRLRNAILKIVLKPDTSLNANIVRSILGPLENSLEMETKTILALTEKGGTPLADDLIQKLWNMSSKEIHSNYALLNWLEAGESKTGGISMNDALVGLLGYHFGSIPGAVMLTKGYEFYETEAGKILLYKAVNGAGKFVNIFGKTIESNLEKVTESAIPARTIAPITTAVKKEKE
jgi:hypothetical protein